VEVRATVAGMPVTGAFHWAPAADDRLEPASYRFGSGDGPGPRPSWADQLPRSVALLPRTPAQVVADRARLIRQGHLAQHWLLTLTQRVLEAACRGPLRRALALHPLIDEADVVQRGLQVAARLLPAYASPRRPPCSWMGMIQLDAKRDMHREIASLDWLPRELSEVADRARALGLTPPADPSLALADLLDQGHLAGHPALRVSPAQVDAALRAPEIVSLDAPLPRAAGRHAPPPEPGGEDPGIEALGAGHGRRAAALARLVTDDPETVVGALEGDPRAVRVVAAGVVRALRHPGERPAATRRRWREALRAADAGAAGVAGGREAQVRTADALDALTAAVSQVGAVAAAGAIPEVGLVAGS